MWVRACIGCIPMYPHIHTLYSDMDRPRFIVKHLSSSSSSSSLAASKGFLQTEKNFRVACMMSKMTLGLVQFKLVGGQRFTFCSK